MTDLLRTSRDGDQFHYLRAARLCLEMLRPGTTLVRVAVEGIAENDGGEEGLDVIDLALYYGSADSATAERIRYRQFKHSTIHARDEWSASGLAKSLVGFGKRYLELVATHGENAVSGRFRFEFETNRPIATSVVTAISNLAAGEETETSGYLRSKLQAEAGLDDAALASFAKLIRLRPDAEPVLAQRSLLEQDTRAYLPDNDKDAPLKLKDLVARKATSEFLGDPEIDRFKVLEAIGATEDDLFPAANLIERPAAIVPREQLDDIVAAIGEAVAPLILEADGGVGKSVTVSDLGRLLPAGSRTFVYDCFGNGGYRSASAYRHRPRDGLVQLANEMAGAGLCDPLIPTARADDPAYMRAFLARVGQASAALSRNPDALLLLVVDAADNAETASAEANDGPSFPRLMLRESWPANVRLLLTARPHRVASLQPPSKVVPLVLSPFSEAETALNLRARFPNAGDQDVREFHRLTSRNPRVQASALAVAGDLGDVLAALGPNPRTVEDTIRLLLEDAFNKVRDAAIDIEQQQLDQVCAALATLRPFVPIDVIAATAGVRPDVVRSIANDLQRPLMVREDAVQFRDEPTETWFRDRFRPGPEDMASFLTRLRPLALTSAYAAAMLPQLMLEAGQFAELVALALSGDALPEGSAIAKRDVELQRLQFALKAALRAGRRLEAAKLALKAGGEAAGDQRQQALLSGNTDLAARFLEDNQLVEQVSRRLIRGGGWTGSEHCYEAAALSGRTALAGDARSRLRLAYDWLIHALSTRSSARDEWDHQTVRIEAEDIAELQLAELNLHGPEICARQLRRWKPRTVSYQVGRLLVARLIDAGRLPEVDALACAAGNDLGLLLAICVELDVIGRDPPLAALRRASRLACSHHVAIEPPDRLSGEDDLVSAIVALASAASRTGAAPRAALAKMLTRYLPKTPPNGLTGTFAYRHGGRFTYLRAYALRAALRSRALTLQQLATSTLRKQLDKRHVPEAERFREEVGALLPWHRLWAEVQLGRIDSAALPGEIATTLSAWRVSNGRSFRDEQATADEVARLWAAAMLALPGGADWTAFHDWRAALKRPLFIPTLTMIARAAGLAGDKALALVLATEAHRQASDERDEAGTKSENLIVIARAILASSPAEARAYFDDAILVAGRIGDENVDRWDALISLAGAVAEGGEDDPELAYRFARAAELIYHYVARDKHFDWYESVKALTGLSPRSAFAVASRWADRRFGREERLLPWLVEALIQRGMLDPRLALGLVAFKVNWNLPALLEQALAASRDPAERQQAADLFWRYIRFAELSPDRLRRIEASFERYNIGGIDLGLSLALAEKRAAAQAAREAPQRYGSSAAPFDWDQFFEGIDLGDPDQCASAYERHRDRRALDTEQFFTAAMKRVPAGSESALLDGLRTHEMLDLYALRTLLEALPTAWYARAAVRPALQSLIRQVVRAHAFRVSASRSYQMLPLDLASERSGLTQAELAGEATAAIGAMTLPTSAGRLFQLAGLVSLQLAPGEARAALLYGLDLIEPLLEPGDGDGPWTSALAPPGSVEASLAGYVWAALSAPERSRRWQAAHAVRSFCALGEHRVIDPLVALAGTATGGPFADPALRFYHRHGLQWLMLALARAATESGALVAAHENFLKALARRSNRHVLVRELAAKALLSLDDQGHAALTPDERLAMLAINDTALELASTARAYRRRRTAYRRDGASRRFSFGIDFPKYQLAPLGTLFGLGEKDMEQMAEAVIRDDWGLDDDGHYAADVRATRGYFRDDHHSRSDGGTAEDLGYYLSYHALMELAGKLLETHQLHEEPDDSWTRFSRWLADELLLRDDGRWLFDQRDAVPVDAAWFAGGDKSSLHVAGTGARELMQLTDDRLVLEGRWKTASDGRSRSVAVSSALVSADRAAALARALQGITDRYAYRLPLHDDSSEIDAGGFQLRGWLIDRERHSGLDRHDPWTAGLSPHAFAPAGAVSPLGELREEADGRSWRDAAGTPRMWQEAWSDAEDEDKGGGNEGRRLLADRGLVDRLLGEQAMGLIVEVEVKRADSRNGKESKDDEPSTTIFLIQVSKKAVAYPRPRGTRPKNRRRARRPGP